MCDTEKNYTLKCLCTTCEEHEFSSPHKGQVLCEACFEKGHTPSIKEAMAPFEEKEKPKIYIVVIQHHHHPKSKSLTDLYFTTEEEAIKFRNELNTIQLIGTDMVAYVKELFTLGDNN